MDGRAAHSRGSCGHMQSAGGAAPARASVAASACWRSASAGAGAACFWTASSSRACRSGKHGVAPHRHRELKT